MHKVRIHATRGGRKSNLSTLQSSNKTERVPMRIIKLISEPVPEGAVFRDGGWWI